MTVTEIAASTGKSEALIAGLLEQEQARGYVRRHGDLYFATEQLVVDHGRAFGEMSRYPTLTERRAPDARSEAP